MASEAANTSVVVEILEVSNGHAEKKHTNKDVKRMMKRWLPRRLLLGPSVMLWKKSLRYSTRMPARTEAEATCWEWLPVRAARGEE